MKESEVTELVAVLVAAFPRPPIAEKTVAIYEQMLRDLAVEVAHRAVARLVATSKWLPTIAEIRAAAVEAQLGARRAGAEAWGDVNDAVRRVGRYGTPKFADPLVAEAVRSLGWLAICDSTNDVADRARFIELYDSLAVRARGDQVAGATLALPKPATRPRGIQGPASANELVQSVSRNLEPPAPQQRAKGAGSR